MNGIEFLESVSQLGQIINFTEFDVKNPYIVLTQNITSPIMKLS